jgi:uncharacterized protein
MSIKQLALLMGLSVLLAACSTGGYHHFTLKAASDENYAAKMGVRYLLGRGVKQDDGRAFFYFQEAAKSGDRYAQNELAYMYAAGKGTKRNKKKAFLWYQRAANQGLPSAEFNLGLMYLHGIGTQQNRPLAKHWIESAAHSGFEPAKQLLATERF